MTAPQIYPVPDYFKAHLLAWCDQFPTAVFLDNNGYPASGPESWEFLAAIRPANAAANRLLQTQAGTAFAQLHHFYQQHRGQWCFGFFSYDLKNEVENLSSAHFDGLEWPDLCFFIPEIVVGLRNEQLYLWTDSNGEALIAQILATPVIAPFVPEHTIELQPRIKRQQYLETVEAIRHHIYTGDIYEMNFCQEFYAENVEIDPAGVFVRLNTLSQSPFATYFKHGVQALMCSSPERFLRKEGTRLVTQPIKGTRRRSPDPAEDARIRAELAQSEKDRSENVMIVDLVRNDFARHCIPGSIVVEELFGIYSFPTVHQMISTVSGRLPEGNTGLDALRDAFPMGSMTGAPKVMSMELIERYERTRRGLYSGAAGYFDPMGNFDFNVVIRSLQYNKARRYLSCIAGGAIVYDSVPEQEYDECLVKTSAVRKCLQQAAL